MFIYTKVSIAGLIYLATSFRTYSYVVYSPATPICLLLHTSCGFRLCLLSPDLLSASLTIPIPTAYKQIEHGLFFLVFEIKMSMAFFLENNYKISFDWYWHLVSLHFLYSLHFHGAFNIQIFIHFHDVSEIFVFVPPQQTVNTWE